MNAQTDGIDQQPQHQSMPCRSTLVNRQTTEVIQNHKLHPFTPELHAPNTLDLSLEHKVTIAIYLIQEYKKLVCNLPFRKPTFDLSRDSL